MAALVTEGLRVTTARLVREAPTVIGAAMTIVAQLQPAQRDLLPALDEGFFRAAVTAVHTCERKGESRRAAVGSAEGVSRGHRSVRSALTTRVKAQRKVVYAAATSLAAGDLARKQRLDAALGEGRGPRAPRALPRRPGWAPAGVRGRCAGAQGVHHRHRRVDRPSGEPRRGAR